jgi:hypothetical protein
VVLAFGLAGDLPLPLPLPPLLLLLRLLQSTPSIQAREGWRLELMAHLLLSVTNGARLLLAVVLPPAFHQCQVSATALAIQLLA